MSPRPPYRLLFACLIQSITCSIYAEAANKAPQPISITHYTTHLEPNIVKHSVSGTVRIEFVAMIDGLNEFDLDCGELVVTTVQDLGQSLKYSTHAGHLHIALPHPMHNGDAGKLLIVYNGTPHSGIFFNNKDSEIYTVFATSQWMPCIDAPSNRATLDLKLVLPATMDVVACGTLHNTRIDPYHNIVYQCILDTPAPSYTYGFAAGLFKTVHALADSVQLNYCSPTYSRDTINRIFAETPAMVKFFEQRAGVSYPGKEYSQVLLHGLPPQEMSEFCVMDVGYGEEVLRDNHEIWLIAHELAHQWWGNMVTCREWTHMWLNEGMATFMVAAFKEERFGKAEYDHEIGLFKSRYERVRDAGNDKSLVFADWNHPTKEDRTIVYQKGAYVLHLLRAELGDTDFWKGIKSYTQKYWGQSVTTEDFQHAMESATGKKLDVFFAKWVYLN